MLGHGPALSPGNPLLARGGAGGASAVPLPVVPSARWHAGASTVTLSGGRVVAASDLAGLADAAEGTAGAGPLALTDAAGRKFWRFKGAEFLDIPPALSGASRDFALFLVCRVHVGGYMDLFSLGSNKAGTAGGAGNLVLDQSPSGRAPVLRAVGRAATVDTGAWGHMIAGSQLQVIGVNCRTTAAGGTVLLLDGRKTASLGQSSVAGGFTGAEMGRDSRAPGVAGVDGDWAKIDLYEAVAFSAALADVDADAVQAALMAGWGISSRDDQLVIEGDSISSWSSEGDFGENLSMLLTEPGTALAGWRVYTVAGPGDTLAGLVARRDQANGWAAAVLPGENHLFFEIGRNDLGASMPAASYRGDLVDYLSASGSGVLDRGWRVRQAANIATSAVAVESEIVALRALLRDPSYLTDTGTGTGQGHEGWLSLVETDLVTGGGQARFADGADAADTDWYYDGTHLTPAAQHLRASGGDDPAKGVGYGLG